MKLIIDIDDEQVLFDIKNRGLESETETDKVIINALYNGIPLDDVKAEIERTITASWYNGENYKKNYRDGLNDAIKILDSIGKTKENEVEE